jgi:hypothetical protein
VIVEGGSVILVCAGVFVEVDFINFGSGYCY